jgi:hypothetical protein
MVTVNVKNPIDLREAGLKALYDALGYEAAQAFMYQSFGGYGDYTAEKYERSDTSFEELRTELWRAKAETCQTK